MYLTLHVNVHAFFVFGVLSALIVSTTQLAIIGNVSSDGNYYIRLEYVGRSWSDAQQMCNQYNATLPIAGNPEHKRSVEAAVNYFYKGQIIDVWLGANASDYGSANWRWLDGNQYSRTEVRNVGTYNRSYAFLSNRSSDILAYAAAPYEKYSYICEYNTITADFCTNGTGRLAFVNESRCFVKYDEKLSWFSARNICLENKGDLASFCNISLLYGIFDFFGSWVGLRHSQWNWQNAVTGLSSEVTFTSWDSDQPNDPTPTCLSINYGDFSNWKDWDCSYLTQYICQVVNTTSLISTESPSTSRPTDPTMTSLRMQTSGSPGNGSNYEANVHLASQRGIRLGVGLGVGLGCAIIIAIVVVIIVIVIRRKNRNRTSSGKSKSTELVATENCQMNPEKEARNDTQSKSEDASALYGQVQKARGHNPDSKSMTSSNQSRSDDSSTHYASVKEVKGLDHDSQVTHPVNQGPVYADIGFEQSRM